MTTSKVNPNTTLISKVGTTNLNSNHHDSQQRITSSKRTTTMINNYDQTIDNNTTVFHESKTHHLSRTSKPKHNYEISKPESGSEDIYTTPLNNDDIRISSSINQKQQRIRQDIGDYIEKDLDEDSTINRTIINKTKSSIERTHHLSSPISNNSAIHLQQQQQQQQAMGDHYHSNTKQHKTKNKTSTIPSNRKYYRSIEQHDFELGLNERNIDRWRLFMYILIILILIFVIYRFFLAIWPKPKKTFLEQLIDDLTNFFTL